MKKILYILAIALLIAMAGTQTAVAKPGQAKACDGCHGYPSMSIDVSTDITSITVSPGESFTATINWMGGANDGTINQVNWPTDFSNIPDNRDNSLFTPTPRVPYSGTDASGTTSSVLTAPTASGTYIVRLYATVGSWAYSKETDYQDITVTVQGATNQLPVANAGSPYSANVGDTVTFDGSGSTDADGSIVSYDWNFGDGNVGTGVNPTHAYTTAGTYTVSLTVTDDGGASDATTTTATIQDVVQNQPPVADAGGLYSANVGDTVTFDGSGSTDTDGSIVSYDWNFGDGNAGTGVNPTHVYTTAGTYTVSLTVTDNEGADDTATTTATIADIPPSTGGTVTFVITDESGSPIEGAKIKLDGLPKKGISTDAIGVAIFTDVSDGEHTYSISKRQYITSEGTIIVNGDITVNVMLILESGGGGATENTKKLCGDGIDNDGDGLIDGDDSDCGKWYR